MHVSLKYVIAYFESRLAEHQEKRSIIPCMQYCVASRHGRLRYARRTAGIEPSTWYTDNETCNKWKNGNPCRAAKHRNNNLKALV